MNTREPTIAPPPAYPTDPTFLSHRELYELHKELSAEFAERLEHASTAEDITRLQALRGYMRKVAKQLDRKSL